MTTDDAKVRREAEGGTSVEAPLLPVPSTAKPPRRVDTLVDSVILLSYAVKLLAENVGEGPLRTKCLELATKAELSVASAKYDPRRAPSRQADTRSKRPGNDARAVPVQARHGNRYRKRRG